LLSEKIPPTVIVLPLTPCVWLLPPDGAPPPPVELGEPLLELGEPLLELGDPLLEPVAPVVLPPVTVTRVRRAPAFAAMMATLVEATRARTSTVTKIPSRLMRIASYPSVALRARSRRTWRIWLRTRLKQVIDHERMPDPEKEADLIGQHQHH
jgi:hypothetical protein